MFSAPSPDPAKFPDRRSILLATACGLVAVTLPLALLPIRVAAIGALLGLAMLTIAAIDADRYIIPDWLSLPAIPAGLIVSGRLVDPGSIMLVEPGHLLGAVAGGFVLWVIAEIYRHWRGVEGLGLGDVKLAAAGGAWVGLELLALVVLSAASSALAVAMLAALWRGVRLNGRMRIPFGAFLAPSIWLVWLAAAAGYVN